MSSSSPAAGWIPSGCRRSRLHSPGPWPEPPQARLLHRLIIEGQSYEEPGEYEPGDDIPAGSENPTNQVLLRCPFLTNLRRVSPGRAHGWDLLQLPHERRERGRSSWPACPRLEELYLLAHRVDMDCLFVLKSLTNLRVLQIYHNYHYPLEILAANPAFKNLTHLLLYPHALEPGDGGAISPWTACVPLYTRLTCAAGPTFNCGSATWATKAVRRSSAPAP